jgi:hypothetical protein
MPWGYRRASTASSSGVQSFDVDDRRTRRRAPPSARYAVVAPTFAASATPGTVESGSAR